MEVLARKPTQAPAGLEGHKEPEPEDAGTVSILKPSTNQLDKRLLESVNQLEFMGTVPTLRFWLENMTLIQCPPAAIKDVALTRKPPQCLASTSGTDQLENSIPAQCQPARYSTHLEAADAGRILKDDAEHEAHAEKTEPSSAHVVGDMNPHQCAPKPAAEEHTVIASAQSDESPPSTSIHRHHFCSLGSLCGFLRRFT